MGATIPEGLRNVDWKKQIIFLYNETYIDKVEQVSYYLYVP